jgi:D-alanine--D-alanine ligase
MLRIGVLRGGTSNKYDESLATGAYVLAHLPIDRYEPVDLFVDRSGIWHIGGMPMSEDRLKLRVDVIWNALHGFYGEDGKVQHALENLGIPYIGSGPLSSAIAMNKKLSKDYLAKRGIQTPRGVYIEDWGDGEREETVAGVVHNISKKLSPPWVVEPISRPNGNGAIRAKTRDELTAILLAMIDADIPVLIEEAVLGKEVSVSTVAGFRGKDTYTFLPIIKNDLHAKLKKDESAELQKIASDVHKTLGLGQYSRTEACITPKGKIYVIATDTLPSFHTDSDLHNSLDSLGVTFEEFAKHLIGDAMGK